MVHFLIVELDTRCELADFSPAPVEIDIAGVWKPAAVNRVPTAPDFDGSCSPMRTEGRRLPSRFHLRLSSSLCCSPMA
jgi:hypothetical protein